jgi:hypothetical protein
VKALVLPPPLQSEFATVEALWHSNGATRRVDALLLCWVKHEKQLRRLFSFLVYQHPRVTSTTVESIVSVLVNNNKLYPETFMKGIEELQVASVPQLLGDKYATLEPEMRRIRGYRNKLMHGQITGQKITSPQIERDVHHLIDWVATLAASADAKFGYDGIRRNTYRAAKATSISAVARYPFNSAAEFKAWLKGVAGGGLPLVRADALRAPPNSNIRRHPC